MIYIRDARMLTASRSRNSIMTLATTAYCGFRDLGEEVKWFTDIEKIKPERSDIVVGSIKDMQEMSARFAAELPVIEYPPELKDYYGRRIWEEPSLLALMKAERTGIFVKPAEGMKKITGKVIKKATDYCNLLYEEDYPVLCSEVVDILSEWRCYVRYGNLLAAKNYAGDAFTAPDRAFIERAIAAYTTAPAGYSLDVGVLQGGKNIVIEINDGYALGTYGIAPLSYAKLLSARYSELMGVDDFYREY